METFVTPDPPIEPQSRQSDGSFLTRHADEEPHYPAIPTNNPRSVIPAESSPRKKSGARNPSSPASKTRECVVVLDFGSQYSPLIVRRIRECGVYAELVPYDADEETVRALSPRALVLSGGPSSAYAPGAPHPHAYVWQGNLPVLGICYGMQLMAQALGGSVEPADTARIRPRHDPRAGVRRCLCGHRARPGRVDESWRSHYGPAAGLCGAGVVGQFAHRRHGQRAGHDRHSVSPGGGAHTAGNRDLTQLSLQCLRPARRLDARRLHR